jgi:diacylglycerol kinase family enzyme
VKVALFVNASAGGGPSREDLVRSIERGGHVVVRAIDSPHDMMRLPEPPAELIVVAGGDGTVAQVLRNVAGRGVPVAILPMGTANNIAHSLGLLDPTPKLIASWEHAQTRPFDFGVASGPWGTRFFIEGAGTGLMPLATLATDGHPLTHELPPDPKMQRALKKYQQTLRELQPSRVSLIADGVDLSGEFLLVEVLNISNVGPNLQLGLQADPFDGALTLAVAREEHRALLAAYLDDRARGDATRVTLPIVQAWDVELRADAELHVDDTLSHVDRGTPLSFSIRPSAVEVLVGP